MLKNKIWRRLTVYATQHKKTIGLWLDVCIESARVKKDSKILKIWELLSKKSFSWLFSGDLVYFTYYAWIHEFHTISYNCSHIRCRAGNWYCQTGGASRDLGCRYSGNPYFFRYCDGVWPAQVVWGSPQKGRLGSSVVGYRLSVKSRDCEPSDRNHVKTQCGQHL